MNKLEARKLDHLVIAAFHDVKSRIGTLLDSIVLVNKSLPEVSLDEIDTSVNMFGKRLKAPIIISGMTGGHRVSREVNEALAIVAEEFGIALGVGSQRAALNNPELIETYRVVREYARSTVVIANIGVAQLRNMRREHVERIIEMVEADAIAVHVNVPQELFQPEGDVDFRGCLAALERLLDWVDVPVIVKETGHSLDPRTIRELRSIGIEYVDVSGVGGTSWVRVEELRARNAGLEELALQASWFRDWGLPTAVAVAAARWSAPDACIIAGGGVWTGLDVAKAIALGADAAAVALPLLRAFVDSGVNGVRRYISSLVSGLKRAMMLVGAKTVAELATASLVLGDTLRAYLEQLGVAISLYESTRKLRIRISRACRLAG